MSFFLPEEWNLFAFSGDARKGVCTFADLRLPRMHLRWKPVPRGKPPRGSKWNAPFHLDLDALREKHPSATVFDLCDRGVQVDIPSVERLLLIYDDQRLYELHWPQAPILRADPMVGSFLENIEKPPSGSHWYWNVYGARGYVPKSARLREASLLPGAPRLSFTHQGQSIVHGAFSLADELMRGGCTLREIGEKHLKLHELKGQWTSQGDSAHFEGQARRPWIPGAAIHFAFDLALDQPGNQICWSLVTKPGFHKIWKA